MSGVGGVVVSGVGGVVVSGVGGVVVSGVGGVVVSGVAVSGVGVKTSGDASLDEPPQAIKVMVTNKIIEVPIVFCMICHFLPPLGGRKLAF